MTTTNQKQGTVMVLPHTSEILRSNPLGDKSVRDLYIYLPPNYEYDGDKKYPVIYCLSGFTGRGKMMLNDSAFTPNMAERMDKLIAEGTIEAMIVVMPDCFTRYGGSQFINSSATGNYEDYLTKEVVPFVDKNFRTLSDRNSRAVAGISSGGYGAMIMAMRHADLFGLASTIAGDCYFEFCYKPDFRKAFKAINGDPMKLVNKFYEEEASQGKFAFDGLNIIGMSACYSPNLESEYGFDLPFDIKTGEIRDDIWGKWLKHDPVYLVENSVENLKSMSLFSIDAGKNDEFGLDIGARILVERLKKLDIPHFHEEFDDGHFNIKHRYNRTFEMISAYIDFD